jgi:hypothetical protein
LRLTFQHFWLLFLLRTPFHSKITVFPVRHWLQLASLMTWFLRTLCVRPVRSKLPARVEAERRKSFDFRNCISMQVNDTAKRYPNNPAELVWGNPCLPGERETAPSLGVRLVSVGRKREAKNGAAKPDGRNVRESDYG